MTHFSGLLPRATLIATPVNTCMFTLHRFMCSNLDLKNMFSIWHFLKPELKSSLWDSAGRTAADHLEWG